MIRRIPGGPYVIGSSVAPIRIALSSPLTKRTGVFFILRRTSVAEGGVWLACAGDCSLVSHISLDIGVEPWRSTAFFADDRRLCRSETIQPAFSPPPEIAKAVSRLIDSFLLCGRPRLAGHGESKPTARRCGT